MRVPVMNRGYVVGLGTVVVMPGDMAVQILSLLKRSLRLIAATDGTSLTGYGDAIALLEEGAVAHKQAIRLALAELRPAGSEECGTLLDTAGSDVEDLTLTVEQAAEVIGVSGEYVRRMARAHRIDGRFEGVWQLDAGSVFAFRDARGSRRG